MKAIPFSKAIRIIKPEYVFLRLKPNKSLRNNDTHKLARTIASLYKNALENVKKEEIKAMRVLGKQFLVPLKVSYEMPSKVSYFIYIEKKKVEFFFIVPKAQLSLIREKMSSVWHNITIDKVDTLPEFSEAAKKYQMVYSKEDALSLMADRRDNDLLNSTLNVVDVMEEGDRAGVFYNFMPCTQHTWRAAYRDTIEKVRANKPVERDKIGTAYWAKMGLVLVVGISNALSEAFSGNKKKEATENFIEALERMNGSKKVSDSTHKKASATILNTQIVVMSESNDALRQRNNARSLAQSFDTISEDSGGNTLRHRAFKGKIVHTSFSISGAAINKMGHEECQNFLSMPGRDVLERFNIIEKVETQETQVAEDLRQGVFCIGESTFRGHKQLAYLSNDWEYRNLLTLLIGPTRAGKSTLIANLVRDGTMAGECAIIFDFIENCELSQEIAATLPKDKVLIIDCGDPKRMQGMGYNEASGSLEPFDKYKETKDQKSNLETLINTLVPEPLSSKMERYLESAALVTFVSGGSIGELFQVLMTHKVRHEFINRVPRDMMEYIGKHCETLTELDETDKHGKPTGGTNFSLIAGIIDRLKVLEKNPYVEMMLQRGIKNNVNLLTEIQKAQLICIKMPQHMFTTPAEKDVYTTYWITKIWLALQIRAYRIPDKSKRTKVNLVIDEIYQVPHTEQYLKSNLSQIAKFICKPIISCHYINQLKYMRDELRSANASYMLISGCDKENFNELKEELHPFTAQDLKDLKRYHSLNYIKCKGGYSTFITALPKPVSEREET